MKNGEGMGRDLYVQLGTEESRAAARVQVVVVDERGELAVDGVLDRRVHRAVDVARELRDQPMLFKAVRCESLRFSRRLRSGERGNSLWATRVRCVNENGRRCSPLCFSANS